MNKKYLKLLKKKKYFDHKVITEETKSQQNIFKQFITPMQ